MLSNLEALSAKNSIRQLDVQFARFIYSIETQYADEVAFISGIVSYELSKGHICIMINELNFIEMLGLYGHASESLLSNLDGVDWQVVLTEASCVGDDINNQNQPLIFDGQRLYLQRYWYYEQFIATKLNTLAEPISFSDQESDTLSKKLIELFPEAKRQFDEINWQKVAVAVALSRRLSVISGGPGTGKTTTVVKLLSALIEHGIQKDNIPKIKLVAPTGKAAARLTESISGAVKTLAINSEIKLLIPSNASTIHRLLGAIPNRAEFRHNKSNPLHLDLLVVDEASMVDLPLMAKLLEALPEHARLVLLGDKDQLASVEAGAVLGDICSFLDDGYSEVQTKLLSRLTGIEERALSPHKQRTESVGLSDSLCMLRKSYRFDESSGIGVLAKAINAADVPKVRAVLQHGYQDIKYDPLTTESYQEMIAFLVAEYTDYLNCVQNAAGIESDLIESHALEALSLFSNCRLLCAIREGDFGLSGLNQHIEKALNNARIIQSRNDLWYVGRPVMITRNDHALGLFNGDIGITMLVSEKDESGELHRYLKVFFELPDGSVKAVLPSRIPEHDTAYAMTIHKSQGSEFPTTVMVLPRTYSPILTKELIYTGVTRAKNRLFIVADNAVLLKGIRRKTQRLSGLQQRLKISEVN
ncbi:exodeoxyribonuclease V subunit alpha [Vibrio sp. DW001]|uniref:exodeoxyribonuclease V subunit alpha n=1 Tax=Vibrio sp. DW001 TaxID=2912315 RepID=UPI0023B0BA8F|nr:exodeoxyribonuclease V subunit alpha [Vibrio sp. DW001]WED26048.1 exodeoxyribonuclease V subunit alpha [Vibrio sp. DW001]